MYVVFAFLNTETSIKLVHFLRPPSPQLILHLPLPTEHSCAEWQGLELAPQMKSQYNVSTSRQCTPMGACISAYRDQRDISSYSHSSVILYVEEEIVNSYFCKGLIRIINSIKVG